MNGELGHGDVENLTKATKLDLPFITKITTGPTAMGAITKKGELVQIFFFFISFFFSKFFFSNFFFSFK